MTAPTVQFTSEPILFGPGVTTVAKRMLLFDLDDGDVLEGYVHHNVAWSNWDEGTIDVDSATGWITIGTLDKAED